MGYFVVFRHKGGCDFTVGCGEKFVRLEAETYEEAVEEAEKMAVEHAEQFGLVTWTLIQGTAFEAKVSYKE